MRRSLSRILQRQGQPNPIGISKQNRASQCIAACGCECNQHLVGRRNASSSPNQTSVSSQEVKKFSDMNESWWDPRKNPLIAMNPVRVGYIVDTMKSHKKNSELNRMDFPLSGCKALDVGCGGGLLSESMARLGASVTSIDPSVPLVEMAKEHAQHDRRTKSIDFRGGVSIEDLVQQHPSNDKFDLVCILEVLEHATNVDNMLQAASSLLKKPSKGDSIGGLLFVSTVNRTLKSHLLTIVGAEYIMGYLPVGTHDWDKYRSPEEVEMRMSRVGLESLSVTGMILTRPPLCGNWDWKLESSDTDVNWIGAYKHASDTPQR